VSLQVSTAEVIVKNSNSRMRWYGHHNKTPAQQDVYLVWWIVIWFLLYVILIWFVITSRRKRLQTFFLGSLSLSSGAFLSLGLNDLNWMEGEGKVLGSYTRWTKMVHGRQELLVPGHLTVHIGLRAANITLKSSAPDVMDFYYNEELVFQRGSRGNNDQYIEALRRGTPNPILTVLEHLLHNSCKFHFENTGYMTWYCLNFCFLVWLVNQVIFLMIPEVSARVSLINGVLIGLAVINFAIKIHCKAFIIIVEGMEVHISLGRSIYFVLASAVFQILPAILVYFGLYPRTSFEVDFGTPWDREYLTSLSKKERILCGDKPPDLHQIKLFIVSKEAEALSLVSKESLGHTPDRSDSKDLSGITNSTQFSEKTCACDNNSAQYSDCNCAHHKDIGVSPVLILDSSLNAKGRTILDTSSPPDIKLSPGLVNKLNLYGTSDLPQPWQRLRDEEGTMNPRLESSVKRDRTSPPSQSISKRVRIHSEIETNSSRQARSKHKKRIYSISDAPESQAAIGGRLQSDKPRIPSLTEWKERPYVSSQNNDRHSLISKKERSSSRTKKEKPPLNSQKERPSLRSNRELPALNLRKERPSLRTKKEQTTLNSSTERPSLNSAIERPSLGLTNAQSSVSFQNEQPSMSSQEERPSLRSSNERPSSSLSNVQQSSNKAKSKDNPSERDTSYEHRVRLSVKAEQKLPDTSQFSLGKTSLSEKWRREGGVDNQGFSHNDR